MDLEIPTYSGANLTKEAIMPIKYAPSSSVFNKATRKNDTKHFYMHTTPTSQLLKDMKDARMTPKRLQKIRNELVRRGAV